MIDITTTHPTKNLMTSTLTIRTFKTRKWAEAYASKVMEAA